MKGRQRKREQDFDRKGERRKGERWKRWAGVTKGCKKKKERKEREREKEER